MKRSSGLVENKLTYKRWIINVHKTAFARSIASRDSLCQAWLVSRLLSYENLPRRRFKNSWCRASGFNRNRFKWLYFKVYNYLWRIERKVPQLLNDINRHSAKDDYFADVIENTSSIQRALWVKTFITNFSKFSFRYC